MKWVVWYLIFQFGGVFFENWWSGRYAKLDLLVYKRFNMKCGIER